MIEINDKIVLATIDTVKTLTAKPEISETGSEIVADWRALAEKFGADITLVGWTHSVDCFSVPQLEHGEGCVFKGQDGERVFIVPTSMEPK